MQAFLRPWICNPWIFDLATCPRISNRPSRNDAIETDMRPLKIRQEISVLKSDTCPGGIRAPLGDVDRTTYNGRVDRDHRWVESNSCGNRIERSHLLDPGLRVGLHRDLVRCWARLVMQIWLAWGHMLHDLGV